MVVIEEDKDYIDTLEQDDHKSIDEYNGQNIVYIVMLAKIKISIHFDIHVHNS